MMSSDEAVDGGSTAWEGARTWGQQVHHGMQERVAASEQVDPDAEQAMAFPGVGPASLRVLELLMVACVGFSTAMEVL